MAEPAEDCERFEGLLRELRRRGERPCLVCGTRRLPFGGLEDLRRVWSCRLREAGARRREVVGLEADWSFDAVAVLLAVLAKGSAAAVVPPHDPRADELFRSVGAMRGLRQADTGAWSIEERLPPFAPFARPPGPGVILPAGSDEPPTVLPLEPLLASLGPGHATWIAAEERLSGRRSVELLLSVLVGGGCLAIPERATRPVSGRYSMRGSA